MAATKGIYTPCAGRRPAASEQPSRQAGVPSYRCQYTIQKRRGMRAPMSARQRAHAGARSCASRQRKYMNTAAGEGPLQRVLTPAAARVRRAEGPRVRVWRKKTTWCSSPYLTPSHAAKWHRSYLILTRASEHAGWCPAHRMLKRCPFPEDRGCVGACVWHSPSGNPKRASVQRLHAPMRALAPTDSPGTGFVTQKTSRGVMPTVQSCKDANRRLHPKQKREVWQNSERRRMCTADGTVDGAGDPGRWWGKWASSQGIQDLSSRGVVSGAGLVCAVAHTAAADVWG